MPKISVIMSVYNGEKYLKEAIGSILNQTFKDFEFIIINDGSTDDSSCILEEYAKKDSRIKVIHQENIGLTKSLNKAIRLAKGEFIARQDVDDISLPERLEKQLEVFLGKPYIDLIASWYYIINEKGKIIVERKIPDVKTVKKLLPLDNLICHTSVMFRKSKFLELGGYDERLKYGQDKDLWMKMGNIEILNISLVKFRKHTSVVTKQIFANDVELVSKGIVYDISSILIQQREFKKARGLLKKHLKNPRHLFYFLLTFLPSWMIDFYMWRLRYLIKKNLSLFFPYYGVIK
ncbi:MAG TPA: glycosyltransferase [Candidatus Atribacteria bacterium]|nr:glycosyltransferase [Candidatus Atribacteria bacterium]